MQLVANLMWTPFILLSWCADPCGKNFLLTMLRLAESHSTLNVVDDQFGGPCYVEVLAEEMVKLAEQHCLGEVHFGTYHLPSSGHATWCDFARSIFRERERLTGLKAPRVVGIPSSEYPTPASRPKYSVMNGELAQKRLGLELPHWKIQLKRAMEDLYGRSDDSGSVFGRSP